MPLACELPGRPDERVLRQLVEALLYEGLVETRAAHGEVSRLGWSVGGVRYRCAAETGAFGRVRITAGTIEACGPDGLWRAAELAPLVEGAAGPGDAAGLLGELERTIAFSRWNAGHAPHRDRRVMGFAALDGALDEGHPYHPCFKARTGFSQADHAAYGPETGATFQLEWLAVSRRLLDQSLPGDEGGFWRAELGAAAFAALAERRTARALDERDYGLVPLHPWQWSALRDGGLAPRLADGSVHALGAAGDRYRASQSVRTLHNADNPAKASVKLAMSMANTSSLRTIEPHSVCVAPALSQWLADIVAGDPLFAARYPLGLLAEHAGVVVDREGPLGGQVAAIWRRSVESVLGDGERAVPFNALMAVEHDGAPFAAPWIARFGVSAWLDRLLDVAVLPVWHLLVRHGVATEAHGQNMILVHREGWPERLILRDFHDSVEFVSDYLADPAAAPDLAAIDPVYRAAAADRFHRMGQVEELRALVMDCLFVFNLAEVGRLLATSYGFDEAELWGRVDLRLRAYAAEHGLETRQSRLGHDAAEIAVESLLAPKLGDARRSRRVANPFGSDRRRPPVRRLAAE